METMHQVIRGRGGVGQMEVNVMECEKLASALLCKRVEHFRTHLFMFIADHIYVFDAENG